MPSGFATPIPSRTPSTRSGTGVFQVRGYFLTHFMHVREELDCRSNSRSLSGRTAAYTMIDDSGMRLVNWDAS